jgi:hypothetical protein
MALTSSSVEAARQATHSAVSLAQNCLSTHEIADRLGISVNSLNKQRSTQPASGPPFRRFGRRILYPANLFESWLLSNLEGGHVASS